MMVFKVTPRYSPDFSVPGPKTSVIAISGDRIISLSMDTMVKNVPFGTPRKGNYFMLDWAYFASPGNNPGNFSVGGHAALITLFTRIPDRKTEPDPGLFFPV